MSPAELFQEMRSVSDWIGVIHKIIKKQPPDQRLAHDVNWDPDGTIDSLRFDLCDIKVPVKGGPVHMRDLELILGAMHTVCNDIIKRVETLTSSS
jgi:hypothetical protein